MPRMPIIPMFFFAVLLAVLPARFALAHGAPIPSYDASAANPAEAARMFLDSLDAAGRETATLNLSDPTRATTWSNLPAGSVPRPGVRLGDLSDEQWDLLFRFLSASLSAEGYRAVGETIAAEAALESDPNAKRFKWSPDNYWLAFFGEPSAEGQWGFHFGGHHLAFNLALEGSRILGMSPTFVGTEPSNFVLDGVRYEPVARMHQAGTAVLNALDDERRSEAVPSWFSRIPRNLATGPGKDGVIPEMEGSHVKDWSANQRELLLAAMREWVNLQPAENASARMERLTEELDETYFLWMGPADGSDDNYFRIQGPSVVIELLWQGAVGAESEGHYHTIYRDPTNEYGGQMK